MSVATTSYPSAGGTGRAGTSEPFVWDDVLRRYGNLVSATVRSFQLQDADALDAMQMTWLRLVENAHRVRFPERLGKWLAITARNECLRICREARPMARDDIPEPDAVADRSRGPEQRVVDAHTAQKLWDIVAGLPPRRRAVVRELFNDEPRSYAELARLAGMPMGGIGPTRARALRQLRGMLDGDGRGADHWR